jgi:hypothetical protein
MYKKTVESRHFLKRAANHSTKGSRRGYVDVLPPEAKEDTYFPTIDQREQLTDRLKLAVSELAQIKELIRKDRLGWAAYATEKLQINPDISLPRRPSKRVDLIERLDACKKEISLCKKALEEFDEYVRDQNDPYHGLSEEDKSWILAAPDESERWRRLIGKRYKLGKQKKALREREGQVMHHSSGRREPEESVAQKKKRSILALFFVEAAERILSDETFQKIKQESERLAARAAYDFDSILREKEDE